MKLLILTVSAGEGHNSMSRSISNYISENYKTAEIKQIDLFKGRKKFTNWLVSKGYFMLCKYNIKFANKSYTKHRDRDPNKKAKSIYYFTKKAENFVEEILKEFKPDSVFCAHTFGGVIMNDLREKGVLEAKNAKVVSVVSDYDVAPYTECMKKIDYIIAPNKDFDDVLMYKGFKKSQIKHFGIPVQTKFSTVLDKKQARKELGIDENKQTVMMMNGGVGFGNPAKLLENFCKLDKDIQFVCVCGRNKKVYNKINKMIEKKQLNKPVLNLGFVNNVDVIMSASDLLVGKIGGIAIAEAFNKTLPILASKKLPWQEYDNMVYLRERKACTYINNNKKAYETLGYSLSDETQNEMIKSLKDIRKQNASKDIGDLLMNNEK